VHVHWPHADDWRGCIAVDQRWYRYKSGRIQSAPIRDFWSPTLTSKNPQIPNLPLETAAGGSVSLTVHDSVHAHAVDNIALTQANTLVVAEALHGHLADNLTLTLDGVFTRETLLQELSSANFGAGAFTTASFTPDDNSLLVVRVAGQEDNIGGMTGVDLTISGGGLTWTAQVNTGSSPGWNYGDRIWTAPVTTGASMTITTDCGAHSMYRYLVEVYQYTGHDASPVGGTASGSDAEVMGLQASH
jgi:hypothetical protein